MREWAPDTEEFDALRKHIASKINMVDIISNISKRVEQTSGGLFTHKCICPNPAHKQGNEKTPSFHFSDANKTFTCWGCQKFGDIFNVLSWHLGSPIDVIVNNYASEMKINSLSFDLPKVKPRADTGMINIKLSSIIREFLQKSANKPSYESLKIWADGLFRRIDERLLSATIEPDQAASFYNHILMEIQRKEAEI